MSVQTEAERPNSWMFRAAAIQMRSATTGKFTGSWVDISSLVKKWGTLETAIDDVRLNSFTDKGISLVVNNDLGQFNHHSNPSSLWFGNLQRYRTLLRVQGAYYDTDLSTTIPADPTLGIFVLDQEIGIDSSSNDVQLRASSLKSIFDEEVATNIINTFNTAMSADTIIQKIRDQSDGSGNNVFSEFITSTAWTTTAGVNTYVLTTDTAANMSVWDLMSKLAEAEGYMIRITRTGGVAFGPKSANQATSQFAFAGQGFPRPTIVHISNYREALDKYYDYFNLKYLAADTSTSYVHAGTTTVINNSNPSWLNGARQYTFDNLFAANTTQAQNIVNNLYSNAAAGVPVEFDLETVFAPGLEVLDRVDISYKSYDLANGTLWDVFVWDNARWSIEGQNFDLNSTLAFIVSNQIDLDTFTNQITVRQI